jgi:hypothetical protein
VNKKQLVMTLGATVLAGALGVGFARHRPGSGALQRAEPASERGPSPSERMARKLAARSLAGRPPVFVPAPAPPPRLTPVYEESRGTPPMDAFDAETRDPAWAPAMENALARRFDPGSVPGWLAGMNLETMECHAHSCRMVVSYPTNLTSAASDRAVAQASQAQTPLDHLVRETGPVAGATSVVSTESTSEAGGSISVRVTAVLAFGPDESNPATYTDWVSHHGPETERSRQPRD